jgi:AP-3 complex subunit delta-1
MDIVKHLMQHVATNQGEYRDQVVATILQICSKDKYALVIDFPWYVSILVRLLTLEGSREGQTVAAHLVDVALRVKDVRAYVVHSMLPYFLDRCLVQERARSDVDHVSASFVNSSNFS